MQTQTSEARVRSERRYWRRTDTRGSWWPWGLLPLLGLLLLFAWGALRTAPHIQAQVEAEVGALLRANAISVNEVDADGQGVAIEAEAPPVEEPRIRALAKSTECDTWAGRLPCPTTVQLALAASAETRPHDFLFVKNGNQIILTGEVANEEERQRTLALARERFQRVVDRLSITNDSATHQYPLATDRALAVIGKFVHGQATWTNGVLEASGFARAADVEVARDLFDAVDGRPRIGQLQIQVAHAAPLTPAPAPVQAQVVSPRAHDFLFVKNGEEVILTGEVPSVEEHEDTLRLAGERFDKVIDRLTVSNEPATKEYQLAVDRALAVLDKLMRGQATWTGGLFEANGLAGEHEAEVARGLFEAPRNKPNSGQIQIEVAQAAAPAAATPSAAPAMASRAHDFVFIKEGDEVILTGEVPSAEQHAMTLKLASTRFGKIVDRLSVSNDTATEQYPLAADRALAVLDNFISGQATWTNAVFEASGRANAQGASDARSLFNAANRKPNSGRILIDVVDAAGRCDDAFRQALTDSTITFRTNSAEIDAGNEVLLRQLAALARECPGALTIGGHTDSRGDEAMNRALSLARAQAVRDALVALGVEADRLKARGFGESDPIADNDTAGGRARNRRIAISMTN